MMLSPKEVYVVRFALLHRLARLEQLPQPEQRHLRKLRQTEIKIIRELYWRLTDQQEQKEHTP